MMKEYHKYYQLTTKSLFPDNEHFDVKLDMFQTLINLLFQHLIDLGMFGPNINCLIQDGEPQSIWYPIISTSPWIMLTCG